jgi:hypothetical protein
MTRGTKFGGGALAIAVVCVGGWYLLSDSSLSGRLRRHLPRGARKFFAPKTSPSPRMANLPSFYLWAWERPENLQFLGNAKVGVAFLAKTISPVDANTSASDPSVGKKDAIFIRPRLQPLRTNPGTPLTAVVRIETLQGGASFKNGSVKKSSAPITNAQISIMANAIASSANMPGVSGVQIDFDATMSEHDFYRALLIEVRKRLPVKMPLSITALASWCIGDRWLEQLPPGTIDEVVPMLFRMGPDAKEIENYIQSGADFRVAACGSSLGVSTDEPFSKRILRDTAFVGSGGRGQRRIYVFSPKPWDKYSALAATEGVEQ